jgi:hypothetical protein
MTMTRIRMGLVPGLLLVLALAVAGCGGGGDGRSGGVASLGGDQATATTKPGGGDSTQADLAYARCMRQHGINLPDPKVDTSGRTEWQLPPGVGPEDPKFKAAQQACKRYRPNGGQAQRPSRQQQQEMLAFARCMRQHGINFPDPKPDGGVDMRGIDIDDPKFKAAERACPQFRPKY